MFFYEQTLAISQFNVNPNYINEQFIRANYIQNASIEIIISHDSINHLNLTFKVIMKIYTSDVELINGDFHKNATFETTKNIDDDLISLRKYVKHIFEEMQTYLMKNIPVNMIDTSFALDREANVLTDEIFSKMRRLNIY